MKKATQAPAKPSSARKKPAPGKAAPAAARPATRADLGAPVEGWFARQPEPQRAIAAALRELVHEVEPAAAGSIKWGMPFYTLDGTMWCAITGHRSHVNLILAGTPETFDDPDGRLEGDGKTGRHLKLRTVDELPRDAVRGWLRSAARHVRRG